MMIDAIQKTIRTLPKGWQWAKLGDLCDIVIGRTPSRSVPEYWNGNLPWVTISDLNGNVVSETKEMITEPGAKASRSRLIKAGTLLFSFKLTIGKMAIAGIDLYTNEAIAALIPNNKIERNYLKFALSSIDAGADSSHAVKGKTLNQDTLNALTIPLPPLPEQRRIAALLVQQMAAVERARAAAKARLEAARALPAALLREVFESEEAQRWPKIRLGTISNAKDFLTDGPFGSNLKTDHYTTTGARVIRLQNIGLGTFLDNDKAYISLEHFATLQRHIALPGDVVIAALGDGARPAGRACVIPESIGAAIVKADCFRVRLPSEKLFAPYLVAYFNSPLALQRISELMRGATRPRVTLDILRTIEIPIPPIKEQQRYIRIIEDRMSASKRSWSALVDQLATINALPAALLRRAFSGEL